MRAFCRNIAIHATAHPALEIDQQGSIHCQVQQYQQGGNMYFQVIARCENLYQFETCVAGVDCPQRAPVLASSCDFGFDMDEEEFAMGLLAPIPLTNINPSEPAVDADEFDSLYRWFAS